VNETTDHAAVAATEGKQPFLVRYKEYIIPALVPCIVLLITIAAYLVEKLTHAPVVVVYVMAGVAIVLGGSLRFIAAFRDIYHMKITVNVFVLVAIAASLIIGKFIPAAIIVFIMSAAGGLESFTLGRTRRAISSLLELAPKFATVMRNGDEVVLDLAEVKEGDVVVVKTGDRIPVDGIVLEGEAAINQAPITGESMPVDKAAGSEVYTGSLSEVGHLLIQTTRVGDDTTLASIVHLVEEAQATKAPVAKIADRFTAYFFPTILLIALAVGLATGLVERAVSVLLVACPCALAIATPTAVTAGIANLARRGVLVKGGAFFELAGKIQAMILDKTGTVTYAKPQVTEVISFDGDSGEKVLVYAADAERMSEHPIGKAIVKRAREDGIRATEPTEQKVDIGHGVVATVNGSRIVVGNLKLMAKHGIEISPPQLASMAAFEKEGKTALMVAADGQLRGAIAVADTVREDAGEAIKALKDLGIAEISILTGDSQQVAQDVAERVGADRWLADLLPEAKRQAVIDARAQGKVVGMIGDGINDAPALAEADVGFAMGIAGTDVAIETADVTLMKDDLGRVVDTIKLSRKVSKRIKVNIFLSIIWNVIGIVLSSLGVLNPVLAVIFQELGCISVILSSTLLLWAD
jgi:heavy metal translocating P-type ATPase